uniref:Reverse transcriptase/retrotransposon-derived protein RNase H-like domain-containing protein n=1 Tax=Amphimedon queenslandica TaxID=400682 RepID=A0A1X7VHN2_AMPQE
NPDFVIERLEPADLTLKQSKCTYAVSSVEYLGHIIDKDGLHPSPSKVEAIRSAPEPWSTTELKSFLGLLNYYSRFLPNLAIVLSPLYMLLLKETKWSWLDPEKSITESKISTQSLNLLVHYDGQKELVVSCNASLYGLGQFWLKRCKMVWRDLLPSPQGLFPLQRLLTIRKGRTCSHISCKKIPPLSFRAQVHLFRPQTSKVPVQ